MISKTRANSLLKKWQKRLALVDWELELIIEDFSEELKDYNGFAQWQVEYKLAKIFINKNVDGALFEETLIHELLHVRLQGHETLKKKVDPQIEFAINTLAALLKNGKYPK